MKKEITPIAMKCNKEQFEAIKPKFEKSGFEINIPYSFDFYQYLCNKQKEIRNFSVPDSSRIFYETWNERIFLEACGIETQETFEITKETIVKYKMKDEFPEVFEVNLEVGKWYNRIWKDGDRDLFLISDFIDNKFFIGEFFRNNERLEEGVGYRFKNEKDERYFEIEATNEEVFNALKIEAVKRGFVEGARITPMYSDGKDYFSDENIISRPLNFKLKGNVFVVDGGLDEYRIFVNGKWAEKIELKKLTKEQIERELGYKIEIIS